MHRTKSTAVVGTVTQQHRAGGKENTSPVEEEVLLLLDDIQNFTLTDKSTQILEDRTQIHLTGHRQPGGSEPQDV